MNKTDMLNKEIATLTTKIKNEFPELVKYLEEIPQTIPDIGKPEINMKSLEQYKETLENLIKKYTSQN